jgi:hypothetical protein
MLLPTLLPLSHVHLLLQSYQRHCCHPRQQQQQQQLQQRRQLLYLEAQPVAVLRCVLFVAGVACRCCGSLELPCLNTQQTGHSTQGSQHTGHPGFRTQLETAASVLANKLRSYAAVSRELHVPSPLRHHGHHHHRPCLCLSLPFLACCFLRLLLRS